MLLDNENIVTEDVDVVDESADEALSGIYEEALESYIGLEEAFGEMQVDQCIDEFKLFKKTGALAKAKDTAKGYAAKAVAWLKKVWNAIKAFWIKVTNKLRSWFMTSEKFYDANKTAISKGAGKVKGFKGYKYGSIITIANKVQEIANSTKKMLTVNFSSLRNKDNQLTGKEAIGAAKAKLGGEKLYASMLDDIRTQIAGNSDAGAFKTNLIAKYRGAAKVELKAADFQFSDLASADSTNKSIAIASKSCDLLMQNVITQVSSDKVGSTNEIAYLKQVVQIFHQAMGVCGSLMAASLTQTKAFAVAAVSAAGKTINSKNEDTSVEDGESVEEGAEETGEALFESDAEWTHYMQECGIDPII